MRLNTAILEAVAADCKPQGIPILFVRLPQKSLRSRAPLAQDLRSRGLDFLDLGTAESSPDIHFKKDGHINATGHQFVAAAIADWIRNNLARLKEGAKAERLR